MEAIFAARPYARLMLQVLNSMVEIGVIPVFYNPDLEVTRSIVRACRQGGARCVEFTNRGDFAASVFLDVTRYFAKADPSVIMGVGSIVKRNDLDGFLRVLTRNVTSYLSMDKADLLQVMELRWLLERGAVVRDATGTRGSP